MLERPDPEPAFFAPFVSSVMRVEPAWIDYNGHLNMAYYNVLFDRAGDEAFDLLGCGASYAKAHGLSTFTAEAHVRYVLRALRSTCSTMFSDVAESQPSSAWNSCSK